MGGLALGLGRGLGRGRGQAAAAIAWFVSKATGSDANTGRTSASPLATFSALLAQPDLASGQTITIADGTFREFLDLSAYTGMTVVGAATKPKITAFDIAANAGFTLTSGRTNTYQTSWTPDFGTNNVNSPLAAHEGGVPLRYRSSIDLCETNPGSYHVPGPANGGVATTVYIHPYGSTNPTSDGKTYEITRRKCALQMGNNATVRDIQAVGCIADDGVIQARLNALIEDCNIEHGNNHNLFLQSGTVRRCNLHYNDVGQVGSQQTMIVFFINDPQNPKLSGTVEDCDFLAGHPQDTDYTTTQGIYAHDGVLNSVSYSSITARNCTSSRCVFLTSAAADSVLQENCTVIKARTIGPSSTPANYTYRGGRYTYAASNMAPAAGKFLRAYGATFYNRVAGATMLVHTATGSESTFENCSFGHIVGASGSTSRIVTINTGVTNNIVAFKRCVSNYAGLQYLLTSDLATHLPVFSSENNVVYRTGGNTAFAIIVTGNQSLSQWQTNTGTDAGSVVAAQGTTTPVFVDPANGNFTTQGASATAAANLQAGVEYYVPA